MSVVPRTIGLGVSRDHELDREVPDALREIYRSWKEAIIREHRMPQQDFTPYIVKTNDWNEIMIVVERKGTPRPPEENQPEPKVFGCIQFVISQAKAEFINFGSSLDDQCLNLGHTTKTADNRLKRIAANGCHWNFGFNAQTSLYCRATPSKAKRETSIEGKPLKLCAEIHEDVAGDLLLDQYYQGHLHLRGIRVLQPVFEPGQAFRFGYNLARGTVGRDRQPLVNVEETMTCIHSIWESAIEQAGDVVLPKYLEIFRGTPPPADARGTYHLITESTAKKMWESLIHDPAGAGVFYCLDSRRNDHQRHLRLSPKGRLLSFTDSQILWPSTHDIRGAAEDLGKTGHHYINIR
ncbi:hypothetical protein P875_00095224 [Aspergillus parasiticus SU-1]|uniref:Uncharacterized protein n=1 Tax=Aspergillus parasiticus (strain ATCC 56775 / NRRL 5862 / SRRC 143 / SU-1) TaxID=1403190 RepID=A0A0F0I9D2_ASPPU|nr:hypothetical protein P875_00095224 [Aspergillus parasiticus SU-1]